LAGARALREESLAIARQLERPMEIAIALHHCGAGLCHQGDIKLARVLAQEFLGIARKLGGEMLVRAQSLMVTVLLEEGAADDAATICRNVLATPDLGQVSVSFFLETMACAECALGNWIRAAVLSGHMLRLWEELHEPPGRFIGLRHDRGVASARAALGDDAAFDAARRRGGAMTTEEAVAYALRQGEM
jgi:hypothetical protein